MNEEMNEALDVEMDDEELDNDVTDVDTDDSDDFEFDDEGNIVIPDDEDDGEAEDDASADEGDDTPDESNDDSPAEKKAPDERDEEIARLKRKAEEQDRLIMDALAKIGVEAKDGHSALIKLAAEAEGVTEEEYVKKREESERKQEAEEFMARAKFEQKKARDLAAVHAAYPETRKYKDVEEFPNFKRFAYLCDHGNTPEEAYISAHREEYTEQVARAVRKSSLGGTKDHLKSAVPKGVSGGSVTMTRAELKEWREMFPHMSDKEIVALYKKTK